MTRKHYEAIAAAMQEIEPLVQSTMWNGWHRACMAIADACKADNARFDKQRFIRACYSVGTQKLKDSAA